MFSDLHPYIYGHPVISRNRSKICKEYQHNFYLQAKRPGQSLANDLLHYTEPSSNLMDIALLVAGTDYYHIECQMQNDWQMVLRMVAYDLHLSLLHTASAEPDSEEVTIRFPRSAVIYPDRNSTLPDSLRCRILFPSQSEHIYQVPAVRIQSHSPDEIHGKHLNLFLPYALLRLKPRLKRSSPLTKEELTAFIKKIIVI